MAGAPYLTWKEIDEAFDRACKRNPYYSEIYHELQDDLYIRKQEQHDAFEYGSGEYFVFEHNYISPIIRKMSEISVMIRCRHSQKYLTDDYVCRKCGAEVWRNLNVTHESNLSRCEAITS